MSLFLILVLGGALFFAWRAITELRTRVHELEAQARLQEPAILGDLIARLTRLEAAVRRLGGGSSLPAETVTHAPTTAATPEVDETAPAAAAAGSAAAEVPPAAMPTPAMPPVATNAPPETAPEAVPPDSEAWEVVVGTSWLNKIGVLVFVVGVALLVGYSFTHIGPLGRVAMGFALSLAMLAAGVVAERRETYRSYAYGLIAGGWAGIYFTAFAMHAVPAARVVDSPAIATALLLAISAGMIGHSLRYRAQTVTALAYIAAYAALVLVPLSSFALLASIPLALSVLAVAARLRWPGVALLGVASTYTLFVLRLDVLADTSIAASSTLPLLTLGLYWLMFEIADIAAARPRGSLWLFPLNAVGLIGAASLQLPVNDPATMTTFTALASAGYLVSAIVRARLAASAAESGTEHVRFGTRHAALALAVVLATWSIDLRFSANAQTLALLTLAELVIVAGLALRDRPIRVIGGAALLLTALHGGSYALSTALLTRDGPTVLASTTPVAVLVALACWLDREIVRSRRLMPALIERTYSWIAFVLVSLVLAHEVPGDDWPMAAAAFAIVLLEAGLRRSASYRYQSYLAGTFAGLMLMTRYLAETGRNIFDATAQLPASDAWMVIMATVLLLTAAWLRLRQQSAQPGSAVDLAAAAPVAAGLASFGVVLLVWHLLPPLGVAPVWAALALGSTAAGALTASAGARWQGYLLATAAVLRASSAIVELETASTAALLSATVVIAAAYAASLVPRRAIAAASAPGAANAEPAGRIVTSIAATLLLTVLILNEAPLRFVTVGWGLEGLALFAAGFGFRDRVLRLSGLGVLAACLLKLSLSDLRDLEPLARIISFIVLGLVLLLVSWTYTRYQEQIRRLL